MARYSLANDGAIGRTVARAVLILAAIVAFLAMGALYERYRIGLLCHSEQQFRIDGNPYLCLPVMFAEPG